MKKRLIAALLCLLLAFPAAGAETLDEEFSRIFAGAKTMGAALVIGREGEIVYELYYGSAARNEPVTAQHYFRAASVTKMISAIRVMQLVEEGKLELDRSIGDYLGYSVENPYAPETPLTLRHLMCHTGALSEKGGYTRTESTLRELLGDSKGQKRNFLRRACGEKYEYSNFGAGIMGALIEAVTEQNVNDAVAEGVFQPLGVDAAYSPTLVSQPNLICNTYEKDGSIQSGRGFLLGRAWDASVNPELHYRATVGSLWIRGRDLCRLGMALCDGGETEGVRLLQEETEAAMRASQQGQGYVSCATPYGLCIQRVDNLLEGRMLYGHQGVSGGVVCNLYYDPETRFTFALMINGCASGMQDRIVRVSRRAFALAWARFGGE